MLTCFSSTFSSRFNNASIETSVRVGPNDSRYYCSYYDHDALINAGVHDTSAADGSSQTECRIYNVYRIKGNGFYGLDLVYDKDSGFPYTGSVLLYIMKYSVHQKTNYNWYDLDIKELPLYTDPGDILFQERFFSNSRDPWTYTSDIKFDIKTNITIKPNQRIRCCMVCFFGHRKQVLSMNVDLTTAVFYNGN